MQIYQKIFLKNSCSFLFSLAFLFQPLLSAHQSTGYHQTNLVSDIPGLAIQTDSRLVNPWGLTFTPKGNLFVAINHSDLATVYETDGTILDFAINVVTSPTGLERNDSRDDFKFSSGGNVHAAKYLFSTEAGTILAYNNKVDPNNAIIVIDRSSFNAVYKGLALAEVSGQQFLYAADFHNAQIDVFDNQFNFIKSFTDTTLPAGFAPFNIRTFNDRLYVTYALQKGPDNHDDQAGPGNGFVDIFSPDGVFIKRLISQGNLNSPWGLAIAPQNFGEFEGALLVGNFGDGKINAYTLRKGKFLGQLSDEAGNPLIIDGLWSLKFKNHCSCRECHAKKKKKAILFFTAGPNGESDGLLGTIRPHRHHN